MATHNTGNDRRPTSRDDARRESTDLDRRYGRIGISAVAAAARYCGNSEQKAPTSSTAGGESPKKVSA